MSDFDSEYMRLAHAVRFDFAEATWNTIMRRLRLGAEIENVFPEQERRWGSVDIDKRATHEVEELAKFIGSPPDSDKLLWLMALAEPAVVQEGAEQQEAPENPYACEACAQHDWAECSRDGNCEDLAAAYKRGHAAGFEAGRRAR